MNRKTNFMIGEDYLYANIISTATPQELYKGKEETVNVNLSIPAKIAEILKLTIITNAKPGKLEEACDGLVTILFMEGLHSRMSKWTKERMTEFLIKQPEEKLQAFLEGVNETLKRTIDGI